MFSEKFKKIGIIDTSGSRTSQRFDYQVACVFLTFLTLYKKTDNFLILLDYIDDFVIIENYNANHEVISFVQVKTKKDKPISISTIVRKEWILKQAENYKKFLDEEVKNVLMTNLGVSFKQKVISDTELISLAKCNSYDGIDRLKKQICGDDIKDLNNFYLLRASISLDAFEQDLKGKMHAYVRDNNFSTLTAESIDTIYLKIWNDLTTRQNYVPTDEDVIDSEKLISKKGLKYSHVKNVFNIMQDIQLPEEGKMSGFCDGHNLYFGSITHSDFGMLFKQFRYESARSKMIIVQEAFEYIDEHKSELDNYGRDTYLFSKKALEILENNETINSSEFYKKFKVCISVFYTYKKFIY